MADRAMLEQLASALAEPLRGALQALSPQDPAWRLEAGLLLQAAGARDQAIGLLRDFVRGMGPPNDAVRMHRALVARLAIATGALGVFEAYLRACYQADAVVLLGDAAAYPHSGVVEWHLQRGRCIFTFSTLIVGRPFSNVAIKHWALILPLLFAFARAHPELEGTVWLNPEDKGYLPGIAFCADSADFHLIPDPIFFGSHGYREVRAALDQAATPWFERVNAAYWRGLSTGWVDCQGLPAPAWRRLPRVVLCDMAADGPAAAYLDVGISGIVQLAAEDAQALEQSGLMRPYDPLHRLAAYRYHIDIDGNTNAWMALYCKLYTGAPVLKVQSSGGFRQWYYHRLIPWYNVVPVQADMSDLHEKMLWLQQHPEVAEVIGQRGRQLAAEMTLEKESAGAFPAMLGAFARAAYQR